MSRVCASAGRQARGVDEDGKWRSAAAAAYPAAMNARLAHACVRTASGFGLRVGSAKPHADAATAEDAVPVERAAPTASSLRRLEAETSSVLRDEAMPVTPVAEWAASAHAQFSPVQSQQSHRAEKVGEEAFSWVWHRVYR